MIAILLQSGRLAAQVAPEEGGPVVVGGERQWETFRFKPVNLTLDLLGRRQIDQISPKGPDAGPTRKDVDDYFRETLTITTGGYVGHYNFIDLDLSGTFGASQEFLDSDTLGRREQSFEHVIEYDVGALILRESEWPLRVYSRRSQQFIDRQFADTIDAIVEQHGAFLQWRSPVTPSTFHYFHREESQASRITPFEFSLIQDTFEWGTQWQPADNQHVTWDYTFDNVSEAGMLRPTTNLQRHQMFGTHNLDFGADRQHNLRSAITFFHEEGDFETDRLRIDESLRLRHTPRFETLYNYNFEWLQSPLVDQTLNRGSAGFRHQLFESLVSTGTVGASLLQVSPSDFTSTELFARLNLDYNKRVPLGRLSAGVFGSISRQDDSEQGFAIQILDEQRAFGSSGIILLNRRNVDPTSIRLTDASGFIVYAEGVDYTVRTFGDQLEIRRVLGGDIVENQLVLLDYIITPEPANVTDTIGAGTSVRYDFDEGPLKGLGVYARYFHQDQERHPQRPGLLPPADIDDFIFGADYRVWYLTFRGEHQIRESTISPFNATRIDATYFHPLTPTSTLTFNATYDMIDRTQEDIQTDIFTIGGRWSAMLTDRLSMNLSALWRKEEDTAGIDVEGFEQRIDLTWQYRQTTIYGSFRNAILESSVSDSMFQTFILGLRRDF